MESRGSEVEGLGFGGYTRVKYNMESYVKEMSGVAQSKNFVISQLYRKCVSLNPSGPNSTFNLFFPCPCTVPILPER